MVALHLGNMIGLGRCEQHLLDTGALQQPRDNNQPSFDVGAVLLLTDGTIMAVSEPNCLTCTSTDYSSWYKFTPDKNGSYVNGTWSQIASFPAGYAPLYFGSAVLPDGRVLVEGGEYNCSTGTCNAVWTNQGAIYDPLKNNWTNVNPPSGWKTIGDAQAVVLANGTLMQANCCTKQIALFNPSTLTWTATGAGWSPTCGQPRKATIALASTNIAAAPASNEPEVPSPARYARVARTCDWYRTA